MKKGKRATPEQGALRARAEQQLELGRDGSIADEKNLAPEARGLVHELQVHQIELELQNEELQRAQVETAEALARYTDLYEHAPVGYLTLGQDGEIRQVNLTGANLLGLERSKLIGRRLGILLANESRAALNALLAQVFESQASPTCEVTVCHESATGLTLELTGNVAASGLECRVVIKDISERRRYDATLRESERKFRSLAEYSVDTIMRFDRQQRHLYVNPVVEKMTGIEPERHIGKTQRELGFPDALCDLWEQAIAKVFASGAVNRIEFMLPTGVWIDWLLAPETDAQGEVVAVITSGRDISERKQAAAKREDLEQKLRMSQKMEAIGRLAGGVAHDFNNLLSVILAQTGFALESLPADSPARNDLLEVKQAGERAAMLTRQLLAFGRRQVMQPVPLDLNSVLGEMAQTLRRVIGEDIEIVTSLAPDIGLVRADPSQFEQVVINLAVNARDAMPTGGTLTLQTAKVEIDAPSAAEHGAARPGPHVLLSVIDTGGGMDAPTLAQLFEPYFTTKEMGKGTGLGLSTVYGIIKQSDGHIRVDSAPGRGTTFKIFLPWEPAATTASLSKPSIGAPRSGGTETILVVEDEAALLRVARRVLVAAGYNVLVAADGEEALRVSAQHAGDIHLLLTDVVMPRMSGGALAERLTATRPATKVLYMSGFTDDMIGRHGVLDAGTRFLGKPFTAADLTGKVRAVLDEPP